jgi:hypothetical protein
MSPEEDEYPGGSSRYIGSGRELCTKAALKSMV